MSQLYTPSHFVERLAVIQLQLCPSAKEVLQFGYKGNLCLHPYVETSQLFVQLQPYICKKKKRKKIRGKGGGGGEKKVCSSTLIVSVYRRLAVCVFVRSMCFEFQGKNLKLVYIPKNKNKKISPLFWSIIYLTTIYLTTTTHPQTPLKHNVSYNSKPIDKRIQYFLRNFWVDGSEKFISIESKRARRRIYGISL